MRTKTWTVFVTPVLAGALLCVPQFAGAQAAPAAAPASGNVSKQGTVKSVSGDDISIITPQGAAFTISAAAPAKVLVVAPGSTDLKTAQPGQVSDISAGDRVLAVGKSVSDDKLAAIRVVVMHSADIASRNASSQADWQRRGSGGIVSAVDAATGTLTVKAGARTVEVHTSGTTIYRRYAPGSVKFEDAKPSTLQAIQSGDQIRVRGDHSPDNASVTAEEIVSGTFTNVSGTIASVDAAANTVTVKDLATKKNVVVAVTPTTQIKQLPPEIAARFAARSARGAGAQGGAANGGQRAARPEGSESPAGGTQGGGGRRAPDLAQLLPTMPDTTLATLKLGQALMIVGSQESPSSPVTAINLLSGVEPLLTASASSGSAPVTLAPWSLGAGEGGGGGAE